MPFIYIQKGVSYETYHKREMPVFGIVHEEVLVGIVVRIT